jgi:hypothetical protein
MPRQQQRHTRKTGSTVRQANAANARFSPAAIYLRIDPETRKFA